MLSATHALALNLKKRDSISKEEEQILDSLIAKVEDIEPGGEFVSPGDRPSHSGLVVEGFAARTQLTASGKRQLTAVHVPGDFVDLHGLLLKVMDHGVMALSACKIALAPHDRLRRLTETHAHLTRLLWLSTTVDAAIHRAWMAAMGRRPVEGQIAHLICELYLRLQTVGMADGKAFWFPATQSELGDMLGKSTVHVNRALQALRRRKAITWQRKTVTILDWDLLQSLAEFDPTYLSMHREPR